MPQKPVKKAKNAKDYPLIISFYAGDDYYYRSGEQLRKDCDKLGLDHHIVEAKLDKGTPWIQLCRYKIKFIAECVRKFKRPVMWIDVDCRILNLPEPLKTSNADFGTFLRGFRYFREFDPATVSRMAQPSIMYFNRTPLAVGFVEYMASLEVNSKENATDDYFLQEAWMNYDKEMSILLMPSSMVSFELPAQNDETFYFGRSGSVAEFKGEAVQHETNAYAASRRRATLVKEASDLVKAGDVSLAITFMKRAAHHSPDNPDFAYRAARLMKMDGDLKGALKYLATIDGGKDKLNHSKRFAIDSYILADKPKKALKATLELIENGSKKDRDWALSRKIRIDLSLRAKAMKKGPADRQKLWWMEGPYPGNFGDMLNPYLIEKLTGVPPRFVSRKEGLIAIGSTIKFAGDGSDVWGAGTPRTTDRLNAKAKYHAVRGPLTRDVVLESGGDCPEVYGDPAVLLPKIYTPKKGGKKYKLGLIRHYHNDADLDGSKDVKVIPVIRAGYEGIEKFIDEVNQCEKILTTSLHGLIVAHAYGIPAEWCQVDDSENEVPGDGTKYHDYMMSVGIKPKKPISLKSGTTIKLSDAKQVKTLPVKPIDLKKLAAAAPFDIVIDLE